LTPLPTHLGLFNPSGSKVVPMVVLGGMVKVNHKIIAGRPLYRCDAIPKGAPWKRPGLALHRHFRRNEIYSRPTYH
jgi:hypothetical protein